MNKLVCFLIILSFSVTTLSASSSFSGKLQHVRVESSYGFIDTDGSLGFGTALGCSNDRVWVDLRDDVGRVAYSTALAALAGQNTVSIRANESSSNIVYGACKMHDIIIHRN